MGIRSFPFRPPDGAPKAPVPEAGSETELETELELETETETTGRTSSLVCLGSPKASLGMTSGGGGGISDGVSRGCGL